MRHLLSLFVVALLALGGCESMPDRMGTALPPQVQLVEGTREQVITAARQAFRRLDYHVIRASGGQMEAASAIRSSETFADARQLVVRLNIRESGPGRFEAELWVTEEVTSKSMGGSRRQELKESGFFGLYFATLQQVLQEKAKGQASDKN